MEAARIEWPTQVEMRVFANLISEYQPILSNKCLFLDGTTIQVQRFTNSWKQREYYSGKAKVTCVNNILVFAPDGCIVFARLNCPGSQHDVRAMGELRDILLNDEEFPRPFGVQADSAFPHVGFFRGRVETPLKSNELARIPEELRAAARRYRTQLSGVRVAVEWGMAGIKNVWGQLQKLLPYDDVFRANILLCVVYMHNFRVRTVELSQIRSTFLPN